MTEAITIAAIFLGMGSMVALPLAVLMGLPTLAYVARGWLSLKERELELHRLEVAMRIRDRNVADRDADHRRSRVASGCDCRYTASRIAARIVSPVCATPPPTTINEGLSRLTRGATDSPIRRPARASSSMQKASPSCAPCPTSVAPTASLRASAAAR